MNTFNRIQVRRGNKVGLESKSYQLADYMNQIKKFIDINQNNSTNKINKTKTDIYLSTDELSVVEEATKKFLWKFLIFF